MFQLISEHWSLVTIHRQTRADSETTTIYCMDSFGTHLKKKYYDLTESFVKNVLDITEFKREVVEVPKQGGVPDCAFFALYNVQKIITKGEVPLEDLVKLGTDWYVSTEASELRNYTVTLLQSLKLQYIESEGGECRACGGGTKHAALLEKYRHLLAAAEHSEG